MLKAARQAGYLDRYRKHPRYGYYYYAEIRIRERSGFWFIERGADNVLVFRFGSMPICTRKHRDGIRLFEHVFHQWEGTYEPPVGLRGYNLSWVRKTPDGILNWYAVALPFRSAVIAAELPHEV